jgi:hypothetical protein
MQRQCRYLRYLTRISCILFPLLFLFVASCSDNMPRSATRPTRTVPHPVHTVVPPVDHDHADVTPFKAGQLSPDIDQVVRAVLNTMRMYGWNPQAETKGQVTGGLYVNWQMNNPHHTNALKEGSDDATAAKHDPQTDLYYLNALAEYKTLHPQDQAFDGELNKMVALITREYAHYNLPKGWLYFYILRDGLLLHDEALVNAAHMIAGNYYHHWYDPGLDLLYNRSHSPGVLTPEQSMMAGAALIDAGVRWHDSTWVQAGRATLANVTQYGMNAVSHLFYEDMAVGQNGTLQVTNPQAKPPTQGAIAEALVKAYTDTHDQAYLHEAQQVLSGLFNSDLVDRQNGGLYFAKDLQSGQINKRYKETRAHIRVLVALVAYNNALRSLHKPPQFQDEEQEMLTLLTKRFYQEQYHGYFYRMTPDYQIYTSARGSGIGYENFFTTEAMGSALDALQQVEFANLPF